MICFHNNRGENLRCPCKTAVKTYDLDASMRRELITLIQNRGENLRLQCTYIHDTTHHITLFTSLSNTRLPLLAPATHSLSDNRFPFLNALSRDNNKFTTRHDAQRKRFKDANRNCKSLHRNCKPRTGNHAHVISRQSLENNSIKSVNGTEDFDDIAPAVCVVPLDVLLAEATDLLLSGFLFAASLGKAETWQ